MLRFPPTSIALSEHDVESHLQEIHTKQELYAQGFSRKEVQRFYAERHGNGDRFNSPDDTLPTCTPSITSPGSRDGLTNAADILPLTGNNSTDTTSIGSQSFRRDCKGPWNACSERTEPLSSSPVSIPSSPPLPQVTVPYRHATVRKSSLLRIMHTAGSQPSTTSRSSGSGSVGRHEDRQSSEVDAESGTFLQSPATRIRSYRPRSKTYTYVESEADPPTPPPNFHQGPSSWPPFEQTFLDSDDLKANAIAEEVRPSRQARLNPHATPFLPDQTISSPLTLPPPVLVSRHASSLQFSLPDRTHSSTPVTTSRQANSNQSSSISQSSSPTALNGLDGSTASQSPRTPSLPPIWPGVPVMSLTEEQPGTTSSALDGLASAPRIVATSNEPSSSLTSSSTTLGEVPLPQTEPRRIQRPAFGVYNDDLPAIFQPQTPTDIQSPRRRAAAESNIAYTAPPGQVRIAGGIGAGNIHEAADAVLQSPTVRTNRMRETRAREWARWRGIWLERQQSREGGRGRRLTTEDVEESGSEEDAAGGTDFDTRRRELMWHDRFDRHFEDQADELTTDDNPLVRQLRRMRLSRVPGPGAGRSRQNDVDWRDVFDEDRVGEENFDEGFG